MNSNPSISFMKDVIDYMKEPNHSLYLWLLDLCVEITQYSSSNRMNAEALGILLYIYN